jgi:hypothetical protein
MLRRPIKATHSLMLSTELSCRCALNAKPRLLRRRSIVNSPQQYQGSRYFRQGGRDESMVAGGGFFRGGRAG